MPRPFRLTIPLLAAALLALFVAAPAPAQADPVRIMPLGDSITGSPGCWRAILWNRLQDSGYRDIDFVGTLGPQGCGQPYDGDNEGHGGALVTNVADQNQLPGWLAATDPDVVLMHFGTNDAWSGRSTSAILAAYDTLLNQMRANNPRMRVLVAQIIPMNPGTCPQCGQRVVDLNAAIPGWAASRSTAQSPVVVVDQWTGFSTASDTYDGVHPNASGDQKMADRWYAALTPVLDGTPPTPGPSPSPSASASPSPGPPASPSPQPGGCEAVYEIFNQWPGGFQAWVRVTAVSAISGWRVTWTFADGQTITNAWGASITVDGARVTATNVAYNGALPAGGTTSFGFLGTWNGANPAPVPTCVPA